MTWQTHANEGDSNECDCNSDLSVTVIHVTLM